MKNRGGFTLVELLISSSMLALLASAGYVVFSAGTRSAAKVRRCGEMVAHAERALTAMATDIRAAVEHDDVRLTSLDVQYEGLDADTIDFIATRTRRGEAEPGTTERCEIGYYIDNDPDTEAQWLVRREDATLDDDPLEGGELRPAGPYVSELNVEFFDDFEWVAGWEDPKQFPLAIRISILVVDAAEVELPVYFSTTVSIPTR